MVSDPRAPPDWAHDVLERAAGVLRALGGANLRIGPESRRDRMVAQVEADRLLVASDLLGVVEPELHLQRFIDQRRDVPEVESLETPADPQLRLLGAEWRREAETGARRAAGKDEAMLLTPPIRHTLESAVEFIADDELVEITPSASAQAPAARARAQTRLPRRRLRKSPPAGGGQVTGWWEQAPT